MSNKRYPVKVLDYWNSNGTVKYKLLMSDGSIKDTKFKPDLELPRYSWEEEDV